MKGIVLFFILKSLAFADVNLVDFTKNPFRGDFEEWSKPFVKESEKTGKGNTAFIAHGRSPESDDTDYSQPRIIGSYSDTFFFGHAKKEGSLQAIVWDNHAGRFEFKVIQTNGQLTVPKRTDCTICHQSETPILSNSGWRELTGQLQGFGSSTAFIHNQKGEKVLFTDHGVASEISTQNQLILIAAELFAKSGIVRKDFDQWESYSYLGIPLLGVKRADAQGLDQSIRASARLLQSRQVCREICNLQKNENLCKQRILTRALGLAKIKTIFLNSKYREEIKFNFYAKDTNTSTNKNADYFIETWPKHQYRYFSTRLADRSPVTGEVFDLPTYENSIINKETLESEDFSTNTEPIKNKEEAAKIADPSHPRPLIDAIIPEYAGQFLDDVAFDCLGFSSDDREIIQKCANQLPVFDPKDPTNSALYTEWLEPNASIELRKRVIEKIKSVCK